MLNIKNYYLLLKEVIKKFTSILMLFSALAMMLGHNLIPHQHHDHDGVNLEHHHSDGEKHNDHENQSEDFDFGHLFSHFQHKEKDVSFLSNNNSHNTFSKQLLLFPAVLSDTYNFQHISPFVQHYTQPLYKTVYFNSLYHLPSGLRAPPSFIV